MKGTWGLLAALLAVGPSIAFFQYERALPAGNAAGQRYIVVDETIWQHARPDLDDVRLYSAEHEIPYAFETERGGAEIEQKEIRVLQPVTIAGKTQFLLDMSALAEYDRIALKLATKNFVAHARVSGQDDSRGPKWALLGTTTLYDLSAERLGHNGTLQIPIATYKFLQVTIDNGVKPADVLGGTAGITRSQKAVWRAVGSRPSMTQQGKDTVLTFTVAQNAPVERVVFEIDPSQLNFLRDFEIQGERGNWSGSGEISRVHMQRGGKKIDVEQTSADIRGAGHGALKAVIHNGDDAPLKLSDARLEQYERRIYFDAAARVPLTLYYGDAQLGAPVYDYAKLFQKDAEASPVELGAEASNAAYSARPDKRPWSERHPGVLWTAIVAAVLVLGGIALKSMISAAA